MLLQFGGKHGPFTVDIDMDVEEITCGTLRVAVPVLHRYTLMFPDGETVYANRCRFIADGSPQSELFTRLRAYPGMIERSLVAGSEGEAGAFYLVDNEHDYW